ncbi:MAG: sigma-54-dependent Fis family transcriptional regulator [Deltaproteobacteria bacterium]|nr:sigma-54-dependent Fis family transcriptional regulator [Deltaproteobacteria bacterium]MBW2171041.1 sigma-54-dependent Fis family transcriptional regulator [Deltaproteobacteria bacterium]
METILIVDDEKNYRVVLSAFLSGEGYEMLTADNAHEALEAVDSVDLDLVLTDMKMPVMDGIELLKQIKEKNPHLPVVMMTAYGTVEKAVEAMQLGAFNFIQKPFQNETLKQMVHKAISTYRVLKENRRLLRDLEGRYRFDNIIGKSKPMHEVFNMIQRVAPTKATVLITGESGSGKELIARAIHYNSPRRNKPFVAVSCAALTQTLLESELFGHERGAFTGATAMKKGRFELADGGTLFLDEIGEIPPPVQVKLLRVLEEMTFERVGGTKTIEFDIRLVAATNKDLKKEVEDARFREDLYFRLNVVHITLPPLRERSEDIPLLATHFMNKYAGETNREEMTISPEAMRFLCNHRWPGNVREFENAIERAVLLSRDDEITLTDLPKELLGFADLEMPIDWQKLSNLPETLDAIEKRLIQKALALSDNVQARAANLLNIPRANLQYRLKKHDLL